MPNLNDAPFQPAWRLWPSDKFLDVRLGWEKRPTSGVWEKAFHFLCPGAEHSRRKEFSISVALQSGMFRLHLQSVAGMECIFLVSSHAWGWDT